ncbi:hypothetical protein [Kitasatospora sp. NPDC091207]|uniref:hypothetical protein n=1 Tax=Kitasatospora sp. NPDC091207 TaxID=3364083 RepID=UPI003814793A
MTLDSWRNQGRVVLVEVADLLAHQLPTTARTQLALPAWKDNADGFEVAYLAVRRTFRAAEQVMDPSPLPKRRIARTDTRALEKHADQTLLTDRQRLLVEVTNRTVEATLAPPRALVDEYWDGSVAVDATPVRTFSVGVHPSNEDTATDPDAAWYVREGDHRDPTNAGTDRKARMKVTRTLFGYEATLVVTGDTTAADAEPGYPHLPALALAFTVHKPGHDPAGNALTALSNLNRRGYRAGWSGADRAYSSAIPETFHIPVRDLGYRAVWDYHRDRLGIQGTHAGALLSDGTWYCPEMPPPLVTATADLLAKKIERTTWRHRVDARPAYCLHPKAAPDQPDARRLLCPASGTHPTAACPSNPVARAATPDSSPSTPPPRPPARPRSAAANPSASTATLASASGRNSTTAAPTGSTTTSTCATASSTSTSTSRTTRPSNAPARDVSAAPPPSPSSSPSNSPMPTTASSPPGSTPSKPTPAPPDAAPPTAPAPATPGTGPPTATAPATDPPGIHPPPRPVGGGWCLPDSRCGGGCSELRPLVEEVSGGSTPIATGI